MTDTPAQLPAADASHPRRIYLLIVLVLIAASFAYFWFLTATGKQWREEHVIAHWMQAHRVIAPLALFAVYLVMATLAMPVWWVQLIAGRQFGLWEGILVCQTAATLSAGLTAWLARWTAGDLVDAKANTSMKKLRSLEDKLGHNGLLVVMATRLVHIVPFGLSNYLFGLLHISVRSVLIGTLLGNLPAVAWIVGAGSFVSNTGAHLHFSWASLREHGVFFGSLALLNLLLLGLLRLRYLRPEWFRKIGIE